MLKEYKIYVIWDDGTTQTIREVVTAKCCRRPAHGHGVITICAAECNHRDVKATVNSGIN